MEIFKYYIIVDNIVTNIALYREDDAAKLGLKMYPIFDKETQQYVQKNWTYLPLEDKWLPPVRDILAEWAQVRAARDLYLAESDLYVMPDRWATYNQDEQHAWSVYRQTLRDITKDVIDPREIIWPEKPIVESVTKINPSEPIDPEG